ncbi:MAG: AMP-binding protein [Burkholderiaceae bacterium]
MKTNISAQQAVGVKAPIRGVVYPPADALARYVEAGALTYETLATALRASFGQHANRIALCGPAGDITYQQLDEITDRLAAAFLQLGLQPADRVIFQLGNSNELVFGLIACLKAALIPVCTLAAHRAHEISYLGQHSGARLHFVAGDDPKFDDITFAEDMQSRIPSLQWIVQARGTARAPSLSLRNLVESVTLEDARRILADVAQDPFQVAVFQLSGGTTGVPKIIPRFNNEYLYNMRAVARVNQYTPDDCLFMPLPMMHNLNMGCCTGPFLLTGGRVTVARDLRMESLVELFNTYQPTWAVLGGPILEKLRPAIEAGTISFSSLRGLSSSNNAVRIRQIVGAPVWHMFGMTEGVIMVTRPGDPQEVIDTMVGRPVSPLDHVKLFEVGSEIEILEPGVEGECAFAGPYTIHGYFDAPERDREAFTSEGYYRSGDLMSFHDIDGVRYFKFCGRTKDVVDRAGEKINCSELEQLLARHPAVAAVSVVGMPDPVYRERVCAFLILKNDAPVPTVADIGEFFLREGVARFKWPERIEVVKEFPLTGSGKLSKPILRKMITDKLATEVAGSTSTTLQGEST